MTLDEAMAGIRTLELRLSVDGYNAAGEQPLSLLEAWAHELAHAVCLGLDPRSWLQPRNGKPYDLSTIIGRTLDCHVATCDYPMMAKDWQEIMAIGAEFVFLRGLGVCQPGDAFERSVVLDAAPKLHVIGESHATNLMFRSARRASAARRAEKIRTILASLPKEVP